MLDTAVIPFGGLAGGAEAAVTPIGRMAFGGNILGEFEEVGRGCGRRLS
jgi:hypothetical protein